jgi:glycosyltransferase involved in cell wall biosynthesis
MKIAVVIPTLNEAEHLPGTLTSLQDDPPAIIIVADCGSTDGTRRLAREAGVEVVTGPHLDRRAAALRAGIAHATRLAPDLDAIWMLHADSIAPPAWRREIEQALEDPQVVGGAFAQRFGLREHRPAWWQRRLLRFTIFCNRGRYRLTGIYFGDQGIFVRPAALEQIGGVPDVPLMEDVELCRNLQRIGALRVSRVALTTSPRRFLRHGVLRQLLADWSLLLRHRLGHRPAHLYARYNADNRDSAPGSHPTPDPAV